MYRGPNCVSPIFYMYIYAVFRRYIYIHLLIDMIYAATLFTITITSSIVSVIIPVLISFDFARDT
jgi:Mg/Co/Ni transporter MgtE